MDLHQESLTPSQHKLFFDATLNESHEVAERAVQRLCDLYDRYPSFRETMRQLWEASRRGES